MLMHQCTCMHSSLVIVCACVCTFLCQSLIAATLIAQMHPCSITHTHIHTKSHTYTYIKSTHTQNHASAGFAVPFST